MSKHYSIEFKHRIVKLILEEHWGIREAAEAFHMPSYTSIVKWLQRFEKYGINGLYRPLRISRTPRMPKRRPAINTNNTQDIKSLLKELKYLRAENAVLKSYTLPKPSAEDRDEILKKTLERLANFEEKTVETLKLNILNQYTDKLSVRVIGESVKDGTIPLDDGVKLFEKTKHLINALALSAKNKKAIFGSNSGGKNVTEFMSQVHLGHTQIGSYIVNLSYPVENIEVKDQKETIQAISFSRSVSHNLVNSLKKLKEKITHYKNNPTSFAELIPERVSHNLCEAIIGLSGSEQQRKVEIKLHAGEISDEAMPSKVNFQFDQNEIKVVQIASKYYQGEYTLPHYEIIGKIVGLHSSNLAEGGYIQVPCKIENKTVETRIDLSPEQYQLAAESHKTGQQIRCKGEILYINKKKGRLQKVTSINIL